MYAVYLFMYLVRMPEQVERTHGEEHPKAPTNPESNLRPSSFEKAVLNTVTTFCRQFRTIENARAFLLLLSSSLECTRESRPLVLNPYSQWNVAVLQRNFRTGPNTNYFWYQVDTTSKINVIEKKTIKKDSRCLLFAFQQQQQQKPIKHQNINFQHFLFFVLFKKAYNGNKTG